jgi:hypothetical protein
VRWVLAAYRTTPLSGGGVNSTSLSRSKLPRWGPDCLEAAQRRLHDVDAKFIPAHRLGRRPGT